jgi:hypothetical protein
LDIIVNDFNTSECNFSNNTSKSRGTVESIVSVLEFIVSKVVEVPTFMNLFSNSEDSGVSDSILRTLEHSLSNKVVSLESIHEKLDFIDETNVARLVGCSEETLSRASV